MFLHKVAKFYTDACMVGARTCPPDHTSVYKIRWLCGDVFPLVFNKSCSNLVSLLISCGVLFSHVDRFSLTAPSAKVEKTVKGSWFGNDKCCLAKSQRVLKAFSFQIKSRDKIYLIHLNFFGLWKKKTNKVLWFTLMLRLIAETKLLLNDEKHAICLKYTGLQLAHMTSPQGVSVAAGTTIPGTDRTYVALGDQGSFVRILRWMLRLCDVTSFRRSTLPVWSLNDVL